MKALNGMNMEGLQRLMRAVCREMILSELDQLIVDTRFRIIRNWTRRPEGLKMALMVFDGLCQRKSEAEITRKYKISRQLVNITKQRLLSMSCMKEFKRRIKVLQRDS